MDEFKLPPAYFADIDGLLAVGGSISLENLLIAYSAGVYYWHHPLKRIQWWSPDPRIVIYPTNFQSEDTAQDKNFELRFNSGFEDVLRLCQAQYNLKDQMSPHWLSERMFRIFTELHQLGYAHSVEAWEGGRLQGGIFGVAIGKLFFGEYQVAADPDIAKAMLYALISKLREKGYTLLDMQKPSVFVEGIEYEEMARINYINHCKENELAFGGKQLTIH